jgi:hypothetical protein
MPPRRQGRAQLNSALRGALHQGLRVGVGDDEFNTFQPAFDHVVDGVAACATHPEYGNSRFEIGKIWNGEIDCHDGARIDLPILIFLTQSITNG